MKRCLSCGSLKPEGLPCPGCLAELGLTPSPRWLSIGALGSVLGACGVAAVLMVGGTLLILSGRAAEERARAAEDRTRAAEERTRAAEESARASLERARAHRARVAAEPVRVPEQTVARDRAHQARIADKPAPRPALAKAHTPTGCDLTGLETKAILGKLTNDEVTLLEQHLGVGLTGRALLCGSKASRMLMVNALSTGDSIRWEGYIGDHLEHLEPTDADLAYKYALHLSKQPSKDEEVIRWATVALDNRDFWSGNTYTSRVYDLHKLRSRSALRLWQRAGGTSTQSQARQRTASFSLEWVEFAWAAGKDVTTAMEVCMIATGSKPRCEGRPQ